MTDYKELKAKALKTYLKLLKANVKHKEGKIAKLEQKMVKLSLEMNKANRVKSDAEKSRKRWEEYSEKLAAGELYQYQRDRKKDQ